MLSFKPTFSLSTFTFIKRLLSSSSLSAIRVVSSAHLQLLIFLLAILIPACASSSSAFLMIYSAYKLNKQGDSRSNYVKSNDESAGQYWGLKQTIPEAAKDEMEKLFGRRPVGASALTSVATNQDLIERLQQKVKETDLTERAGLDEFRTFYQSVMKPAYDTMYPAAMAPDALASVDRDMEEMTKMVDFARRWMNNNQ